MSSSAAPADGESNYALASVRPLESLLFVSPLLLAYEAGVFWLGARAARNGADAWLRQVLDWAGFGQYFLLPLLTCLVLMAWHHARREPWHWPGRALPRMWAESALWAAGLLLAVHALLFLAKTGDRASAAAAARATPAALAPRLVGYLGAAIYEELLFRLLLIPPTLAVLARLRYRKRIRLAIVVAVTSLLFAAAHYQIDAQVLGWHVVWPHGERFAPLSFVLRLLVGAALALVFVRRGFGIAVGAHALYDLSLLIVY